MGWRDLESFSFGDSPALADELSILVLEWVKTATCWAAVDGQLTEVGKRMAMLDGSGVARAVLETMELSLRRFNEVDATFAFDEDEGDRSLKNLADRTSHLFRLPWSVRGEHVALLPPRGPLHWTAMRHRTAPCAR
jgi:uncharacterized protein YhfF